MELKEFAEMLSGREYKHPQFTEDEIRIAKENNIIIISGASDDLMEIDGLITDEADVFDGGIVHIQVPYECEGHIIGGGVLSGNNGQANVFSVDARWCLDRSEDGKMISWTYHTSVPYEEFDIMEDGEIYCRGIVIKAN